MTDLTGPRQLATRARALAAVCCAVALAGTGPLTGACEILAAWDGPADVRGAAPRTLADPANGGRTRQEPTLHVVLRMAAALTALALAGGVAVTAAAGAPPASATTCRHIAGPFHTSGGAVYTASGRRFIPYGINLTPLSSPGLAHLEAEEDAAASGWCANLVRFGTDQDAMIKGGKVNRAYLSEVETVAAHARADGLDVALVMFSTRPGPALPVWRTEAAWRALAYHYRTDTAHVIFDIYNEPTGDWPIWRNGGMAGGTRRYGMEQLARYIRAQGARNLLWVEGHMRGGNLYGIPQYHLTGVGPVMYSEHRPPAPHTPASWWASFASVSRHWPVVEGEWANYDRANATWACWADGRVTVGRFLTYLADHRIGLVAYDLEQPRMLESASLTDPNHIRANWQCVSGLNEGAGSQIMHWFALHN